MRWRRFGALAVVVAAAGCLHRAEAPSANVPLESERYLTFYDHPLEVHLARQPQVAADVPLLLYATGDGGWRGKDRAVYREMITWGYPAAGFSAPDYLKHLGFVSGTTTPTRLARDYQRLIAFAKTALDLPASTRTILVGVSRGAGLAVVAAGRPETRAELCGVLAVALTKEEEYVRHYRVRRGTSPSDMPRRELVEFETYEFLDRLRSVPLVVIQSTHDDYLPAEAARRLFGPDTALRRLYAIDAADHSFGGARPALYERMASALAWIREAHPLPGQ
jgi:pimeloyl-ACP methyl ester carboxylesterase